MNMIAKYIAIGGLTSLSGTSLAAQVSNIEVCLNATYTNPNGKTYDPQDYALSLAEGNSKQTELPTPSAYFGWFGMQSPWGQGLDPQ